MHNAAVILVFHGSRNPQSEAEAAKFAESVRASLPGRHILHGFLRECSPDIRSSIAEAAKTEARTIRLIPVFALTGNHISVDIPNIMREAEAAYPDLTFTLDPVLVGTTHFLDYIKTRIIEA